METKTGWLVGGAFVLGALTVAGGVAIGVGLAGGQQAAPTPAAAGAAAVAPSSAAAQEQPPAGAPEAAPAPSGVDLTAIDALQRNTFVAVAGEVVRFTDEDEFILRDEAGDVQVWTGGDMFPVQPGELITVRGYVDDDLIMELYAQEIIRSDGEVIVLRGRE